MDNPLYKPQAFPLPTIQKQPYPDTPPLKVTQNPLNITCQRSTIKSIMDSLEDLDRCYESISVFYFRFKLINFITLFQIHEETHRNPPGRHHLQATRE